MRFVKTLLLTYVLLGPSYGQAADPQLTKQIAVLQQQVIFLQKELWLSKPSSIRHRMERSVLLPHNRNKK